METKQKLQYKEELETKEKRMNRVEEENGRLRLHSQDTRKLQEQFEQEKTKLLENIKTRDEYLKNYETMTVKLSAESAQLKVMEQEYIALKNRCIPDETDSSIFSEGRKGHERQIADLNKAVSNLNAKIERDKKHYEDRWKEELEVSMNAQGNLAHSRILSAGLTCTSLNHTVVAQFIQPNEADIRTARMITGLFSHPLAHLKAWNVWPVSRAEWFSNPTDSRIVIVSDLEVAVEVQAAFNEHKILGEYVGCTSRPPQPAGSIYGPATPDIQIVIFPEEKKA
jgi:hypothetical protein